MSAVSDTKTGEASSSGSLSEEYSEMLALLETEFQDRYTEKDPHFQFYLKKGQDTPPIVENYFGRPAHRDGERREGQKRRYDDRRHDDRRHDDRRHGGGHRDRYDQRRHHYQDHRSRDRWSQGDNRGHHYRDQRQWNQQRRSGQDSSWT